MKRTWVLTVLAALCALSFTGCTSNADTMPSPSPSVSASPMASPSVSPSATATASPSVTVLPSTEAGVNSVEDAARVSENVAEEVEKLSELDTVEAVVAGNISLVGIRYDTQYQGGLTERLTEMVDARVQTVDKTLTTVHVTDDEGVVEQIAALSEKLTSGDMTFDELQTQALQIGSQLAGGGSNVAEPQSTAGA